MSGLPLQCLLFPLKGGEWSLLHSVAMGDVFCRKMDATVCMKNKIFHSTLHAYKASVQIV